MRIVCFSVLVFWWKEMRFMLRLNIGKALVLILLSSCVSQEGLNDQFADDPIEPVNRLVFSVNDVIDTVLLQPTAYAYKKVIPAPIREVVYNFLDWLSSPVYIVNSALQGDFKGLKHNTARFVANAPMFGLVDNATGLGLKRRPEDFGQTLAVWGVYDGPYLVLPLLGPSNLRDTSGLLADYFMDPTKHIRIYDGKQIRFQVARHVGEAIDFRARNYQQIKNIKDTSIDYYARVRTIYKQRRNFLIKNNPSSF
ncbi:vacJ like lipofamily protein [Candidatus Endolissoclinum faulkneri L2]|uniref:VacJ like lipofamily protein n=1 Tax=Candidatus Endolissoclinum faulkneri L2 TaxID=1193729 RepID=K7ZCW2_9PROT|nr:VacJ family lipoprotein [Candidatus Endolissoclinum faulkneri]AFX98936.1 vacJ like lipofamily protein [Candidatus Endolissoclinum faulkneri L2]